MTVSASGLPFYSVSLEGKHYNMSEPLLERTYATGTVPESDLTLVDNLVANMVFHPSVGDYLSRSVLSTLYSCGILCFLAVACGALGLTYYVATVPLLLNIFYIR